MALKKTKNFIRIKEELYVKLYIDLRQSLVSFRYSLYVSKIKELIDAIKKISDIDVFPAHAIIRGIIFGYSLEEINEFMETNKNQVEIADPNEIFNLIDNLIKKGILKENLVHDIILTNPKINDWIKSKRI